MSEENGNCSSCADKLKTNVAIVPYGKEAQVHVPVTRTSREVIANMLQQSERATANFHTRSSGETSNYASRSGRVPVRGPIPSTVLTQSSQARASKHIMLGLGGASVGGHSILAPTRMGVAFESNVISRSAPLILGLLIDSWADVVLTATKTREEGQKEDTDCFNKAKSYDDCKKCCESQRDRLKGDVDNWLKEGSINGKQAETMKKGLDTDYDRCINLCGLIYGKGGAIPSPEDNEDLKDARDKAKDYLDDIGAWEHWGEIWHSLLEFLVLLGLEEGVGATHAAANACNKLAGLTMVLWALKSCKEGTLGKVGQPGEICEKAMRALKDDPAFKALTACGALALTSDAYMMCKGFFSKVSLSDKCKEP